MADEKDMNPTPHDSPPEPGPLENKSHETNKEESEDAMLSMLDNLPNEGAGTKAEDIKFESASVAKAEFQQLTQAAVVEKPSSIDLLLDVNLPVSIELGRTQLAIADILALGPGSIVELSRLAGEPVDVMVNHKLVAKGEVVVVDENFGVRITQLITPQERLRLLGEA